MRLDGLNGTSVRLTINGYQFPRKVPAGAEDWDANWLLIAGEVSAAHGRDWSFHGSPLTTWEVDKLAAWLLSVSRGEVPVLDEAPSSGHVASNWTRHPADAAWLTFTEPNLNFAVGGYHGHQVDLLVGFAHDSAPPAAVTDRASWYQVTVAMDAAQVQDAGAALQTELAAHPAR